MKCTEQQFSSACQSYYALAVFTLLTAVNQLHRYLLIAAIEPMSNDLEFGDKECSVYSENATEAYIQDHGLDVFNVTGEELCMEDDGIRCINQSTYENQTLCDWHYLGTGIEYEILAGPVFIIEEVVGGTSKCD